MEHRLYGAQASVVVTHGLSSCSSWTLGHRLGSCGVQAELRHGMWDLLSPQIDSTSPALAAGFFLPLSHQGIIFIYLAVLGLSCGMQDF